MDGLGATEKDVRVYTLHFPRQKWGKYAISLDESKGADLKQCVHCFPAKKGGVKKQKSAKEAWKQPIFAKMSTNFKNSLPNSIFLYSILLF